MLDKDPCDTGFRRPRVRQNDAVRSTGDNCCLVESPRRNDEFGLNLVPRNDKFGLNLVPRNDKSRERTAFFFFSAELAVASRRRASPVTININLTQFPPRIGEWGGGAQNPTCVSPRVGCGHLSDDAAAFMYVTRWATINNNK